MILPDGLAGPAILVLPDGTESEVLVAMWRSWDVRDERGSLDGEFWGDDLSPLIHPIQQATVRLPSGKYFQVRIMSFTISSSDKYGSSTHGGFVGEEHFRGN